MIITLIILGLAIVVVALLIVVARKPDGFCITRTKAISALPGVAFAQVNDLHRWQAWSPWEGIDPNLKRNYEGSAAGVGATYAWEGSKTGAGAMTITQSQEPAIIGIELKFLKPFKATNAVEFTFQPQGPGTVVSWSMSGKDTFATKIFCLLCNRDKMCSDMFDKGLEKLKTVCESA